MNLANYHLETGEFLRTVVAMKKRNKNADVAELENESKDLTIDDYLIPPYHTPSMPDSELADNEYHCFLDKNGNVPRDYENGSWTVKKRLVECVAYNKQTHEQKTFDDASLVDDDYTLKVPPSQYHTFNKDDWALTEEAAQKQLADVLASSIIRIDNIAAQVTQKWARFAEEYKEREAAAIAYQNAGFTGDVSVYISSFASVADKTDKEATLLILKQAQGLRALQEQLAVQRMRKYELKQPKLTIEQIQTLADEICANIQALGDSYE